MTFEPGFRLSLFDVLVLIAGMTGAIIFGAQVWWLGVVIGFVVGHFFLSAKSSGSRENLNSFGLRYLLASLFPQSLLASLIGSLPFP